MNFNKKKLSLGLIALSLSSMAFAGGFTPPTCTPGNVTVPCEKQAWDIGFTGMYVQTTNNDLFDYRIGPVAAVAGATNTFTTHVLSPDHDFAFNLQGSYHWGTGSDINLNWTHLKTDTYSSNINAAPGALLSRFFAPLVLIQTSLTSTVQFKHDAVNLEFGQTIDVSNHVNMRFHAGAQWARVEGDFNQIASNNNPTFFTATNHSKFDGLGPRLGMDASYDVGHGFSILGRSAIAALVGDLDTDQTVLVTVNPGRIDGATNSQKARVIVPSVNADLGAAYKHTMSQGDISIEAGYRVAAILHSVRWATDARGVNFNATTSGQTGNAISNFGYHGPYATIKWVGSVA